MPGTGILSSILGATLAPFNLHSRYSPKMKEHTPKVRVGRYQELNLYQVTEEEINKLAEGSSSATLLNFSIFCISMAISFTLTLATTEVKAELFKYVFVSGTFVGYILGVLFFFLWWRTSSSTSELVKEIKGRLAHPGLGTVEELPQPSEGLRLYQLYIQVKSTPTAEEIRLMASEFDLDVEEVGKNKAQYWNQLKEHIESKSKKMEF